MDWSSDDPTVNFGDSIYVPAPGADEGIYVLDEADRLADPDRRRPYTRYEAPSANGGLASWSRARDDPNVRHSNRYRGQKEGYYTGGNIGSMGPHTSGNTQRIFDVAWDERPQQYNPNVGAGWAKLLPTQMQRPHNGVLPLPSLAYPILSTSEAQDRLGRGDWPSAPAMACMGGGKEGLAARPRGSAIPIDFMSALLLIVIIVLLAMLLTAAGRIERKLSRLLREAIGVAGGRPPPDEPDDSP
jgi:hypothetical protein